MAFNEKEWHNEERICNCKGDEKMKEQNKKSKSKELMSWVWPILIAIVIAFVVRQFLISPVTVKGESMEPTYHDNDRIMIWKPGSIDRDDVIVFQSPVEDDHYIKRVIGLPGDTVKVENEKLYVNDKEVKETYIEEAATTYEEEVGDQYTVDFTMQEVTGEKTVPKDSYFVLGDNRPNSSDSRMYGFIKRDTIDGKVLFRYYPWK